MTMSLDELDRMIGDYIFEKGAFFFEELALFIHTYQFNYNSFYRGFCVAQKIPEYLTSWQDIPFFPIESFKGSIVPSVDSLLSLEGMWFETSGTSIGEKTRVYRDSGYFKLRSLTIIKQGEQNWFHRFNGQKIKIIFIDKANRRNQESFKFEYSVLNNIMQFFGRDDSVFCNHKEDFHQIVDAIVTAAKNRDPLVIIGPTYYFSYLIERIKNTRISIPYNERLLIMDSGGLKGKGYHNSIAEYRADLFATFKLNTYNYKNTYAMTEMGSQVSDTDVGWKEIPRWMRLRLVDDKGRFDVPKGKIVVFDLLNRANLFGILTNDIACYDHGKLIIEGRSL